MRVAPDKRVPRQLAERKRQFRKALALAEMTAHEWAVENGIGPTYLSRYLAGRSVSGPLGAKIDAFIAKQLGNHFGRRAG